MEEFSFSPEVETALRQAGWEPGRQLSLDELAPRCVLKEYPWRPSAEPSLTLFIFPAAFSALKEFGGLKVSVGSDSVDILNFDPALVIKNIAGHFEYGWLIGLPLYPLAIYHSEDDEELDNANFVAIDAAGKIWVKANEFHFIGQNIREGIEFLVSPNHWC